MKLKMNELGKILLAMFIFTGMLCLGGTYADAAQGGFANNKQQHSMGGYTGPGPDLVTVEQAKQMRDDSHVAIKGRITRQLGDEHYIFEDATGSVNVDIDHKVWRGLTVGPSDVVIIYGEVDKDMFSVEIDVDRIVKP